MTGAGRRVVVVGSVNHDLVVRAPRHPGPGETVVGTALEHGVGGKGLNQAVAAARAGAEVAFVAAVGDDDAGAETCAFLEQERIDASTLVTAHGTVTGHAVVTVDEAGENSIVVVPGANAALDVAAVRHGLATLDVDRDDVVVLQHELAGASTLAAAALASAAGATVVWNAAPAPTDVADVPRDVDVVVVNAHELAVVARLLDVDAAPPAEAGHGQDEGEHRLRTAHAVGERLHAVVVVTLGADGSVVVDGDRTEAVPAAVVDVVDTTAAGDTFIGQLAARLRDEHVTRSDLVVAGTAAGLTVGRAGAATSVPTRAEVDEALRASGHAPHVPVGTTAARTTTTTSTAPTTSEDA